MQKAASTVSWVQTSLNFVHSWQFRFGDKIHLWQRRAAHTLRRKWEERLNDFLLMLKGLLNQVWNHSISILWRFSLFKKRLLMQSNCPQSKRSAFFPPTQRNPARVYYYADKNVFGHISTQHRGKVTELAGSKNMRDALSDNAQSESRNLSVPSGTSGMCLYTSVFSIWRVSREQRRCEIIL